MSSISNQLPDVSSFNPLTLNRETSNKTQFSSTAIQIQENSEITLFTKEGDKVTISSTSRFEASYATYSSRGLIDGNAFQIDAEAFSVSKSFAFELSVEGDLSAAELKDIKKALKTIEKLTRDFFSGKTDKALDRAKRIAGLDSIASFEAVLQYSKSISAQVAVSETAPANIETSTQMPAIEPAVTALEVLPLPEALPQAETTDATPPIPGPLPPSTTSSEPVNHLVEQMTDAVLASNIALSKIASQLDVFLDSLFAKLSSSEGINLQTLDLVMQVKTEFSFSIQEALEAEVASDEHTEEAEAPELENHTVHSEASEI